MNISIRECYINLMLTILFITNIEWLKSKRLLNRSIDFKWILIRNRFISKPNWCKVHSNWIENFCIRYNDSFATLEPKLLVKSSKLSIEIHQLTDRWLSRGNLATFKNRVDTPDRIFIFIHLRLCYVFVSTITIIWLVSSVRFSTWLS
jgi:hypothetical protein